MDLHNLHRRKSSKDEDENIIIMAQPMVEHPAETAPLISAPPPPRNRVQSTPMQPTQGHTRSVSSVGMGAPPSAGPFRNGFNLHRPPNGINGHPSSPFRSSFNLPVPGQPGPGSHSRTRSISSTSFSPSVHSPLASSFPQNGSISSPTLYAFPPQIQASHSLPDAGAAAQPAVKPSRRHQRLHSRNLSVFFPRPGSLPQTSISEDGSQELEVRVDEEAPISTVPSAAPPTPLGAGFTFGARPPGSEELPTPELMTGGHTPTSTTSRRGHHHKHSMSHNFFSFLEPGANGRPASPPHEELHTQPTPVPVSPWTPMSAFPQSAKATTTTFPENGHQELELQHMGETHKPPGAVAVGVLEFILGAWLWVCGQQIGSLAVTGLGYWVVFDAFGVGLGSVLPNWLDLKHAKAGVRKSKIRRSYGNAPVETVFMFAQAVYLMFSSVYVCKETVEHLLLSAGGGEGHHHHHGDEDESLVGYVLIEYPVMLACITLISVIATSILYNNHAKIVSITGNRIPGLRTLIRSLSSSSRAQFHDPPPTSTFGIMISNPFTSSPLFFCIAILAVALFIPKSQHRACDLILATIITVVTFNVAYRASVVLGTVLLQTSPPRGASSGKMEAFLRAMREVERHPQVLHLPAPHIWQLTPTPAINSTMTTGAGQAATVESLVVTMELHVRHDLADDEVLKLTRWAWEKCAGALGGGKLGKSIRGGPEVTVGVVRG
ncbi:hypothetical protein BDZ94DRAFT_1370571 [Collybia nuda]|uniref:Uncharacterized protein n=1 Tax=Collybia nuda TaxID=64659 RepID=A0A9P5Y1Y6_9AGAR|nr:hypothetical protein BDZ94DRAFT_1370571 [Collybia nuda]